MMGGVHLSREDGHDGHARLLGRLELAAAELGLEVAGRDEGEDEARAGGVLLHESEAHLVAGQVALLVEDVVPQHLEL